MLDVFDAVEEEVDVDEDEEGDGDDDDWRGMAMMMVRRGRMFALIMYWWRRLLSRRDWWI